MTRKEMVEEVADLVGVPQAHLTCGPVVRDGQVVHRWLLGVTVGVGVICEVPPGTHARVVAHKLLMLMHRRCCENRDAWASRVANIEAHVDFDAAVEQYQVEHMGRVRGAMQSIREAGYRVGQLTAATAQIWAPYETLAVLDTKMREHGYIRRCQLQGTDGALLLWMYEADNALVG